MARQTVVKYFSDLSGEAIASDSPTIQLGLDGTSYEIDLTDNEQKKLRELLAPYVEAGSKVPASRRHGTRPASGSTGPSAKEIRTWAKDHGFEVPTTGRVPALIREAYGAAH